MTKPTRRATKTDTLISNARGELNIRGLNRHRIIPRVIQPPSGGANTPPSGQGSGSTGNFLQPQGDTMVGPIGFFPRVATIDKTDSLNPSIDINSQGLDYSTYILTGTDTPESLATILGANFAGQLLYLQMTAPGDTTIINGTASNSGNILTGTGVDLIANFGDILTLIFDVTASTGNVNIQGAWRLISGPGGAGAVTNAKTGFMLTTTGSTQVVPAASSVTLDVFNITVLADGVAVSTTNNTITVLESGRYIFGLNLTLSADSNNTTADFALVVNGVPLTNVNSVFLRGFGDNSGLYPTAPSDFTTNDVLEIEISHDKGVPVTFTFQECGFYLIKQESGGGSGGGATTLDELTDVAISTPLLDQVLTFDGALWVNQAPGGGGLNQDLSNMTSPTVPTVPLNMNQNDILGVTNIDMDGVAATIQGVTNIAFFQANQSINSLASSLVYQVGLGTDHQFVIGGADAGSFIDAGSSILRLDMKANTIQNVKDFRLDIGTTYAFPGASAGFGFDASQNTLRFQVPTGKLFSFEENNAGGGVRINPSGFGAVTANSVNAEDVLQLGVSVTTPLFVGEIRSDGTDVLIFSGGIVRNISDIGTAGNAISQGNSSVTVLDSGVGSITDIIDGTVVSTKNVSNFSIQQSVTFGSNKISGLGDAEPAASGVFLLGGSTLFWANTFTDRITLDNAGNTIIGSTAGMTYNVALGDIHEFEIGFTPQMTIRSTEIDFEGNNLVGIGDLTMQNSASNLQMSSGDIIGVDDLTFVGSGSRINMVGGDIINVDDIDVDNIEIDGALNHDGSTIGFFGTTPVTKQTSNLTGTTVTTLVTDLSALLQVLRNYGIINTNV